ncbi:MAG: M28 family metallopeptidase [Bacteroidota bacterium]|jgi:aminopeptidase YwaD
MITRVQVLFLSAIFFNITLGFTQNLNQAKSDIAFLTSKKCFGRGYTKSGLKNARNYLIKRIQFIGLKGLVEKKYLQTLTTDVNVFPGDVSVKIDGKNLSPGRDFIISEESKSTKGTFLLEQIDSVNWIGKSNQNTDKLYLKAENKLTWSVSTDQADYTLIKFLKSYKIGQAKSVTVDIDASIKKGFGMDNILAYVPGISKADSFIVFTAHYDHLGGMGKKTFFPGANDNASGVSMLLQLAEYYNKHPSNYSIAFMFFCGEEAGLLGSKYYSTHPAFPLEKIKFLINLDLLGTGEEGVTVVNATEFPTQFNSLKKINSENNFLPLIKPRGKAANSDHYWFTERGVPGFFIYTLGGIKAYHDIFDVAETLPLTKFDSLFKLFIQFQKALEN